MGFYEDLESVVLDPKIMRLAERRAGSRELALDAVQATYLAVSRVKDPEGILDLAAFVWTSLIREINHQRTRASCFTPVEDIASAGEQGDSSSGHSLPDSVEHEVEIRRLAQSVLDRLDGHCEQLMAAIPGRSANPLQYRIAIVAAARAIFLMLIQGSVTSADWNAALKSSCSWFAEDGLSPDLTYQRLSRGRLDVRMLLQRLVPREQLG